VIGTLVGLFLLASGGAGGREWRLVYQDGSVGVALGAPGLTASELARLRAAWSWSATAAPRRSTPAEVGRAAAGDAPEIDRARLAIRVVRAASRRPPGDLRVIAAPIEMWREVPEGSLPSWPVPASGRLLLPVDGVHRWRVRVAGAGEGSWWADAQPQAATLAVATTLAAGIDLAVEDERGRPLGAVGGFIKEGAARLRDERLWAAVRGVGRLDSAGLPDGQEVTIGVMEPGYEPAIVRGWPSALPRELRLRRGATLAGRVTDAAGKALPEVTVEVEAWARAGEAQWMRYRAVTDARGAWSVQGVPHGKVALTLRKHGFVPRVEQLEAASGATDVGARQLDRGGQLAVLVRDAAGPLAGARIEAAAGLTAIADGAGIALLDGVPPSALTLRGVAERHQAASLQVNPPFATPVVLTLPRAFTVLGRFVDGAGAPVGGGVAEIEMPGCSNSERLGDDGSFALTLAPGKAADLVLRGPRVRELRQGLAAGAAGEVRDLGALTPPPGIDVIGRVVSQEQAAPVAGARVWLPRPGPAGPAVAWANRDVLETSTDETGSFRLSGLAQGASRLRIDAAGFARVQADVGTLDPAAAGGVVDLGDLAVSPGTRLHVLVRASGRSTDDSLEGATARVDLGNQWLDPDMLQAEVHDGEAVVPNVPAGPVTVSVLAGQKLVCDKRVTVGSDGSQASAGSAGSDMDVDCSKKAMTVAGAVKLGDVAAGAGYLVWRSAGADGAAPGDSQIDNVDSPGGLRQQQIVGLGRPQVSTSVDDGSRFQTQDLSPGPWSVSWTARTGALSGAVTVEIPDLDSFVTELVFPGLAVTGTVSTQDGKPAAGARVRELTTGDLAAAADDGTFTLGGLQAGPAVLQAQQGDLSSRPLHLDIPAGGTLDPVKLVVGDGSTKVTIQVATAAGAPAGGAFVFFEEQGRGIRFLTTGADGAASAGIEGDPPPAVRAAAYAAGLWTLGPWTAWDAAQQGLALAIDPSGRGSLVVSSARGATLKLLSSDGWDLSWLYQLLGEPLQAAPAKPLEVQGLPAGAYGLSGGQAGIAIEINVPAAGAVEARLDS
jgi:hypothetical protein